AETPGMSGQSHVGFRPLQENAMIGKITIIGHHREFALLTVICASSLYAAGTLKPTGSPEQPIQIRDHHVQVVINNGFARTEVVQTFFNPNAADLEAIYSFPVPKSGSLAQVTAQMGEKEIHGEVLPKREADALYEDEKSKGNDTGVAKKNTYQ